MDKKWWKEAVVYEIYCKSFCDTDGDGIGDLEGVRQKLPMLKELGVNCLWFTPIYTSPQVDNGYDTADYEDIDPVYGGISAFKRMLDEAHKLGIRVIMDMALNHTSDQHRWFIESRKSKDNPYRNYYIWKDPKEDGSEPNNWGAYFRDGTGSAWCFDETTGQYYFHQYSVHMPDLNWEYEPMRQEIYGMLRRWLEIGVDGFRLDIFTRLKKPLNYPDTKKEPDVLLDRNGYIVDTMMCTHVPGIHTILHDLWREVFGTTDCMTMGEGAGVTPELALSYVAPQRQELDMLYHFQLSHRNRIGMPADHFRKVQRDWAAVIRKGGWAVQYMSNHDSGRQVSSYGSVNYRKESAKLLGTLLHTTPGTPLIYQGEEIGMTNVRFDRIEDYNCCYTVNDYPSLIEKGYTPDEAIDYLAPRSRDNARTPYPWNSSENAGFTTGTPWLKVNPAYQEINLEADRASADSVFAYYQKLTALRREHPVVVYGDLEFLLEEHRDVVAYIRDDGKEKLLVIANISDKEIKVELPCGVKMGAWKRILTNREDTLPSLEGRDTWLPWETEVYIAE